MNPSQTEKRPITADAALMNPVAKILALRSGENLQVTSASRANRLVFRGLEVAKLGFESGGLRM